MTSGSDTQCTALKRLCFGESGCFLVPAEALSTDGLSPDFAQALIEAKSMTASQISCLERGFSLYWRRCHELFERAPGSWFPPRQLNVLLISDSDQVSPYLEPFPNTSATLYLSDLDTDPEYVAYMWAHAERLAMLRALGPTLTYNLSWWLICDDTSITHFKQGAHKAKRPDANVFTLLAEALDWVSTVLHNPLRQPDEHANEPYVFINGADLYIPKRRQSDWMHLCTQSEAILRKAMERRTQNARPDDRARAIEHLCHWLHTEATRVALSSLEDGIFWTPHQHAPDTLRRILAQTPPDVINSLHQDLSIVQDRSQTFFNALRHPDQLPSSCPILENGSGAYVDARNRWIVYELKQPNFDARTQLAPPFHRRLLGARVMHEWGHLAHAAKWIHIPQDQKSAYQAARADIGDQWMRILRTAPDRMHAEIETQLAALTTHMQLPSEAALTRKTLARVGDYLSNRLAIHFIPPEEMHAYVRVNVCHHLDEALDFISELSRYAYEIQYLRLVGLPRSYFFNTSYFNNYFIDSGLVQLEQAEQLFDAVWRALSCYAIDERAITLPALTH